MRQYEGSHRGLDISISTFDSVKLWILYIASMPLNKDLWKQTVEQVHFHVCK